MEQIYVKLDVTAVNYYKNFILAGVGVVVYVFCAQKKSILNSRSILKRYKIRGFSCTSGEEVLCFGGKEVGVFKVAIKVDEVYVIPCALLKHDDWVTHSKWVDSDLNIVTLSAHNVITLWNWKERNKIWQVACREQNILYSGFIFGSKSVDLICFGGTVFGEIEVWAVHGKEFENIYNKRPVLHHLTGHKGAVFSVSYNDENQYICSTSDDRSVRWWKVSWSLKEEDSEKQSLFQKWSTANIAFISVAFGHLSRVWKCLSADSVTFTVGEDSQICVWKIDDVRNNVNQNETKALDFPLLARKQIFHGGSIWSLDFSSVYGVVIGLEDGGIILFGLASLLGQNSVTCLNPLEKNDPSRRVCLYGRDLQPIVITRSGAVLVSSDKNLSWQNVLGDHRFTGLGLLEISHNRKSVAVTSSSGDVVVLSRASRTSAEEDLRCVASTKLQEGYALSIHWLATDLLLTCGLEGKLQLWHLHQEKEIGSLEELGNWILPFSKQRWTTSALWIPFGAPPGIILCGNRSGDILLYQGHCKNPLQSFRNVHGHMGVTSFLLLNYKSYEENIKVDHWVPSYSEMYSRCQHSNTHEIERNAIIYSTGRDGVLKSYVIRDGHLKMRGCEQLGFEWAAKCFVLNGKIFVFGFKGAYAVVWGVQERSVLLEKECGGGHRSWDLDFTFTAQKTLNLRLALIKNGKLSMVNWETPSDEFLKSVLQEGLHSKEVYCVKWLDMMTMKVSGEKISAPLVLISGSEDTTAKINRFCPTDKWHSYELSAINTLCGHLSSIRTLSLFPLPQSGRLCDTASEDPRKGNEVLKNEEKVNVTRSMNFLVFTAGGRAQLKVWKLCFDVEDKGESGSNSYVSTCRVEEKASLLLGTRKYGEKEILTDPEARFMEVCAFCCSKTADSETLPIALAAACSDGILRIFGYPESQNKGNESRRNSTLRLHSEGFPHCPPSKRHCLFRVSHRMLHNQHLLITTDTMGYFHLWDVTPQVNFMKSNLQKEDSSIKERSDKEKLEPFFIKLVHSFSINALDWLELSSRGSSDGDRGTKWSSLLLLATGGEDGTLALNILRLTRESDDETWKKADVLTSWKDEFVMSTQISGLKFIGNKYLVTVSKGQQVVLWSWKCNLEDFSISASIVHQYFTSVADVQDMEVIETMNGVIISICGCGIEVIHLTIPEKEE